MLVALLLVTLAGFWIRIDNLGIRSFSADEVLHVFAARSLLEEGEPLLPSGEPYRRALPLTRLMAAAFERWGESEATARLPSVVAGVLVIPVLYAVGASMFGPVAGLLAAFLIAFSPDAVAMSRFARMYAPVQLLALLAAWGIHVGLSRAGIGGRGRAARRAAWLAGGGALLLVAARLHAEAYLLVLPIGLYLAAVTGAIAVTAGGRAAIRSPCGAVLAAGLAAAALVVLVAPEQVAGIWRRGMTRLPWFPSEAWDPKFYHLYLADTYDYLWFLAPAATVALLVTAAWPGLYVALLFWVPFVCLSAIVPTQSPRYLSAFLPFLFLLLGEAGRMAGGLLLDRLVARLAAMLGSLERARGAPPAPRQGGGGGGGRGVPGRLARPLAAVLFAVTLVVVVRASPWFAAAQANRFKPAGEFAGAAHEQWRELAAYVAAAGVADAAVISHVDHLALYYLGRADGRLLYRNHEPRPGDPTAVRTAGGWRFRSYTTGVPAFSGVENLSAAVARHPRGWLIIDRRHFETVPSPLGPGVRSFVLERLTPRRTPADASLAVFSWDDSKRVDVRPAAGR